MTNSAISNNYFIDNNTEQVTSTTVVNDSARARNNLHVHMQREDSVAKCLTFFSRDINNKQHYTNALL